VPAVPSRVALEQADAVRRERAAAEALATFEVDRSTTIAEAVSLLEGGSLRFLRFIQMAADQGDEASVRFMEVFTLERVNNPALLSLDRVAMVANVDPSTLIKSVLTRAFSHMTDVGNLMAAMRHPRVVDAALRSAERIDSSIGQRDRHALLTHAGFLPTPKGATILVNATANAAAAADASHDASMPSFLDSVNRATVARDGVQAEVIEASVVLADGPEEAE
jgi:hypothetical protein